ncbi:acyltransferase [Enterococcus saccharolyticus]|uniref:Acyltransferase n=1 Tax=Enterococcus saccharolyticus subsp. saccharolyticus ATCC 43076 TaxID=1139996 RepID=S0NGI4_9ENTE|nr:acyltransferase [Enterococcus saccharolyticus]EOT30778.1 hypothetical protein OMQ_00482 [Enterococcus saccharolyticus subsp. saccharolyticus ATCC 43076]EOT80339.1 hypothetical protein I572_00864 [Enterococcus saccharolyticus subsp. saccharolyticus ATCC 43076]OJG85684.1 hypothetical protein RV16_GL001325 [Enterococcus saccharolyticus]
MFIKLFWLIGRSITKNILKNINWTIKFDNYYYRKIGIKIGRNVRSFTKISIAEPYLLEIKDNVTISTNVTFISHDNSLTQMIGKRANIYGDIVIGNNCFIGNSVVVLPGIKLGDTTIVAAGSVVTKSFPEGNVIIGGNPAKIIGSPEKLFDKYIDKIIYTDSLAKSEIKNILLSQKDMLVRK